MLSKITKEAFILTWPGDDPISVKWDGEVVMVPDRKTVARTFEEVKGSPYRFGAAVDAAGKPLAGTVAIVDILGTNTEGGAVKMFDARAFAIGIEVNHKGLLARGLEVVVDAADVPETLERNREKFEETEEINARAIVAEELKRQSEYEKKNGIPAPRSSSSEMVTKAMAFLKTRAATPRRSLHDRAEMQAALGFAPDAQRAVAPVAAPVVAPVEDEAGVVAEALQTACEEAGVNLTKPELVGLLKKDPAVMKAISEKLEKATVAA